VSPATPASAAVRNAEPGVAALAALRGLCAPLTAGDFEPACVVVQPDEIPQPADALLVHHEHMTEVLHKRYGRPVELAVLDERLDGDRYTRKVKLAPGGADRPVVEWGAVRLDFRFMSSAVRDEILAKRTPLGAILIKHDVHRRIKPRWFMRFPARGPTLAWFGDAGNDPLYGRIGTIYCDEEPAIELLEIVTAAPVGGGRA
jgi:hypothetical protein